MSDSTGILDGIGGVFIYANDAAALVAWYEKHFDLKFTQYEEYKAYGLDFVAVDSPDNTKRISTIFSIQVSKDKLPPERNQHTINFRVRNLASVIDHLRSTGVEVDKMQDDDYGRFA